MGRAARLPMPAAKGQEGLDSGRRCSWRTLVLGVCVKDVTAASLRSQRSELLTSSGAFQRSEMFMTGINP